MAKNIIICSDGTGNTFDSRVTNVTRLIKYLALDDQQIAVYDQGVGTSAHRCSAVDAYRKDLKDQDALRVLPPPLESRFWPKALIDRGRGLLVGYGLKENVREMYRESSRTCMRDPMIECFCSALAAVPSLCAPWPACCPGANSRRARLPTSTHVSSERGSSMSQCLRMRQRPRNSVRANGRAPFTSLVFGTR